MPDNKAATPSAVTTTLIKAKQSRKISFEELGKKLGRDEVAVAAIFYGQAHASEEDIVRLSKVLDIREDYLREELSGWPDRGGTVEMPRMLLSFLAMFDGTNVLLQSFMQAELRDAGWREQLGSRSFTECMKLYKIMDMRIKQSLMKSLGMLRMVLFVSLIWEGMFLFIGLMLLQYADSDGIMSAIAFSTHVDKEVDQEGNTWVKIQMRGKWLPYSRF